MLTSSPRNERGDGQVSHLLLAKGQFGSQRLCITWVECQPGSQQAWHRHLTQEQVYVIVRGQGQMLAAEYSLLPAVASHAIGYAESTHGVRFARDRQRQGNGQEQADKDGQRAAGGERAGPTRPGRSQHA